MLEPLEAAEPFPPTVQFLPGVDWGLIWPMLLVYLSRFDCFVANSNKYVKAKAGQHGENGMKLQLRDPRRVS